MDTDLSFLHISAFTVLGIAIIVGFYLGHLVRHVFFDYHDPYIDTRKLTHMAISETAGHFMQREPHFAVASEDLQEVLQRMIKYNIKEIPIVDDEKKIVADLTIVDLLNQYRQVRGADLP